MQFSRAKRFVDRVSDVPPVGAYDVPTSLPSPAYKRGAMLEKADRFTDKQLGPDTFGLYDPATGTSKENRRPRASMAPIGDRTRNQLEEYKQRMQAQHDKEVAKLQSKIARLESAREESHAHKAEAAKELASLKAEIRSLTSRETSLSTKLAKAEASLSKHQSLLPQLQSKLEQLTTSHSDSRKRKENEIAELKATVAAREIDLEEATDQAQTWEARARAERKARRDAAKIAGDEMERLRILLDDVRVGEVLQLKTRCLRLERQLGDRIAQVDALAGYSAAMEEEVESLKAALSDAEQDRDWALETWRQELQDRRSEKEWRQRARSDQREMLGLRDEVKMLEAIRETEREIDHTTRMAEATRSERLEAERKMLERELEVAEGELDLAINEEIPRLEDELESVKDEADELRDRASELHEALSVAEGDIKELQVRATEELERHEGELEEERRRYAEKEMEVEKERTEKRRVAGLLGQSRAAQDGLREELDAALSELGRAQRLQADNKDLARTVDQLSRLQAATEQDNKMLADQNTELISHGNPHQKIRHLAAIREELVDSKRKHLKTTSDLSAARAEIASLQSELDAYRSISPLGASAMGPPSVIGGRTRVSRPVMDDVLNPNGISGVPSLVISDEAETWRSSARLAPTSHSAATSTLSLSADSAAPRKAGRVAFSDDGRRARGRASVGATRMEGPMTVQELIG